MKVRAKSLGYYGHKRRYEGDEFYIKDEKHFSAKWMKKVEAAAPAPKKSRSKKKVEPKKEEVDSSSEVI